MNLASIFTDNMILQCNRPVKIWGESKKDLQVEIKINSELVYTTNISKGEFSFEIPPQKAQESATIQIGDITLNNVDFGEVFIAGGQSNMEFLD